MFVLCTWLCLKLLSACSELPMYLLEEYRMGIFFYMKFKFLYYSSLYLTRLVKLQVCKCSTGSPYTHSGQDIWQNKTLGIKEKQNKKRIFTEIYCLLRGWLQLPLFTAALTHSKKQCTWKQSKFMTIRSGIVLLVWVKWPPS